MNKVKTKGISFSKRYEEEYNHVMKMKGASSYICELIRRDLRQKNKTTNKDSQEGDRN